MVNSSVWFGRTSSISFVLDPERFSTSVGGVGATAVALEHDGRATRVVLVDQVVRDALPDVDSGDAGDLNDPVLLRDLANTEASFETILCLDVLEHLVDAKHS